MTAKQEEKLGAILWDIANELRGAMNADDFRDYMLSFLFLRYLSGNYEGSVQKELGTDYPKLDKNDNRTPLSIWYNENPKFERLFRIITENMLIANLRKNDVFFQMTSKDRYTDFVTKLPNFIQRVPQYMIASYLEITPEYLSELRRQTK